MNHTHPTTKSSSSTAPPSWNELYDGFNVTQQQQQYPASTNNNNYYDPYGLTSHNNQEDRIVRQSNWEEPYTSYNTSNNQLVVATDSYPQQQRTFHGRPVKAKNAHLPDEVLAFKERRKARTVASTWAGGVAGLIVLGPVLGPLAIPAGAGAAYGISKSVGKARERRLTERCQSNSSVLTPSSSGSAVVPYQQELPGERGFFA